MDANPDWRDIASRLVDRAGRDSAVHDLLGTLADDIAGTLKTRHADDPTRVFDRDEIRDDLRDGLSSVVAVLLEEYDEGPDASRVPGAALAELMDRVWGPPV